MQLLIENHPLLDLRAFVTEFPNVLEDVPSSRELLGSLSLDAPSPFQSGDDVQQAIRDLLRHGGFKPTGRSKPASEYLRNAAGESRLSSINVAVDAANAVSLHSGLPISVIDLDLSEGPFRVGIAPAGSSYVFNHSGQTIDLEGLICLFDGIGPCANGVKDSQRTKTHPQTRRTLSLIWGTIKLPGRAQEAESWYHELLQRHGATIEACSF